MQKRISGFTIVELLIVIVIIAILAAISIVVYSGMQNRSRDAARASSINSITKALALYHVEEGRFPNACGVADNGCNASLLSTYLVPKYASSIATDPQAGKIFHYVTNTAGDGYGIRVEYHKGTCKHLGGSNPNTSWWNSSTAICS